MNISPSASVIITNHNYGEFLSGCIDSALAQGYLDLQIIVVDDNSCDGSRKILQDYGETIDVVLLPETRGQAGAINAGFKRSRGSVIFLLDGDDIFENGKIKRIMDVFRENPRIGWCIHRIRIFDDATGATVRLSKSRRKGEVDIRRTVKSGKVPLRFPSTSGLCFSRKCIQKILPIPESADNMVQERCIWAAAAALETGFYVDDILASVRLHGSNVYTGSPKQEKIRIKRDMVQCYYMRRDWPVLRRYSNALFGGVLGLSWKKENRRMDYMGYWDDAKTFLAGATGAEKVKILARALWHAGRGGIKSFPARAARRGAAIKRDMIRYVSSFTARVNPRPVFILGNQRSGTSAIAALLGELTGKTVSIDLRREQKNPTYDKVFLRQRDFHKFLENNKLDLSRDIAKEPNLTLLFPFLLERFPEAKFVFVARDPRENIASILDHLGLCGNKKEISPERHAKLSKAWRMILDSDWLGPKGNYVQKLAERWRYFTRVYLDNKARMTLVKYEDFVADKKGSIERLARELGLPEKQSIAGHEDRQFQPASGKNRYPLDFFGKENLSKLEDICLDGMCALGYALSGDIENTR